MRSDKWDFCVICSCQIQYRRCKLNSKEKKTSGTLVVWKNNRRECLKLGMSCKSGYCMSRTSESMIPGKWKKSVKSQGRKNLTIIMNLKSLENIFHSLFRHMWISRKWHVVLWKYTYDPLLDVKQVEEWNAVLVLIPYVYFIRILRLLLNWSSLISE